MADKTVLDFPEITTMDDEDVLYGLVGTGAERDKHITKSNLLKEDRARLTQNETDISTNAGNISTNTGNIATNTAGIGIATKGYTAITGNDSHEIISTEYEHIIDAAGLTGDSTLTVTKGAGATILNKIKVSNPSAYQLILDGGSGPDIWCNAGETFDAYFIGTAMVRSEGWGCIFDDYTETANLTISTDLPMWKWNTFYRFQLDNQATPGTQYNVDGYFNNDGGLCSTNDSATSTYVRVSWNSGTPNTLITAISGFSTKKIWRWYSGAAA